MLLFIGVAWAQHASTPQPVHFADTVPILDGLAGGRQ